MTDKVVIKSVVSAEACNHEFTVGHNMFVVSLAEWKSFEPYLKMGESYYEDNEMPFDLYDIYKSAQIIDAEESVLDFIEEHGEELHLTYIRLFIQKEKKKADIYGIIERIALLPQIRLFLEQITKLDINFPNLHRSEGVLSFKIRIPILESNNFNYLLQYWIVPNSEQDIERIRQRNIENFSSFGYEDKRRILAYDDYSLYMEFPGYAIKISVAENQPSTLYNVFVKIELVQPFSHIFQEGLFPHDEKYQKGQELLNRVRSLENYAPRICNLNSLSFSSDDDYVKMFTSIQKVYTGERNQFSEYFLHKYVKPENVTNTCALGCYYILTENRSEDIYNLKGNDKIFFDTLCKSFKVTIDDYK
jgi:hypothetical protein